jgi:hypothetical protein
VNVGDGFAGGGGGEGGAGGEGAVGGGGGSGSAAVESPPQPAAGNVNVTASSAKKAGRRIAEM